jgi:hypothetical protein
MIKIIAKGICFALLASFLGAFLHAASAQGMEDTSLGTIVGRSSEFATPSHGLPISQITSILKSQGYTNISNLSSSGTGGAALQAIATDPDGNPVSLMVDPMTASILSSDPL